MPDVPHDAVDTAAADTPGGDTTGGGTTEPAEGPVTYPGARKPDRRYDVDSSGLRISVVEWGDPERPVIFMAHGGFDFSETYDVFAPLLVEAGYRVVCWDQRGHGDSEWPALYNWESDARDAIAALEFAVPDGSPVVMLGHSKGGSLVLHLANALPHRVTHVVNLDGLPSRRNMPDVAETERTRLLLSEVEAWLGHRHGADSKQRRPDTLDGLAKRRAVMNPRLSHEWLRYLVSVGARHDAQGWRWKIDPVLRLGGFGPWRPEWSTLRLPGLNAKFFGILGLEPEMMGWGTVPADVEPLLPPDSRFLAMEGVGHFLHIEQPRTVADMVLEFIS